MAAFNLYGKYLNPYLRIVRITDSKVFDVTTGVLAQSPVWADSAIVLGAKNAVVNGWPVTLPDLPNGSYDIQLYDSAAPSNADAMIAGWRLIMPHQIIAEPTQFPLDVFGRIRIANA